jgi:hypothetical protein
MNEFDFDSIRPFNDDEIAPAIKKVVSNPKFDAVLDFLFPGEQEKYRSYYANSKSVKEIQTKFMYAAMETIAQRTSKGITHSGFEKYPDTGHIIISNHRDILLDPGFLCYILMKEGFQTVSITFGNNLILSPFFENIAKLNKMITVIRDGSPRELLFNSIRLSKYISQEVIEKRNSIWVAQRPGRTKNGDDKTEISILKMLSYYEKHNYYKALKQLDIYPMAITYEWEPCDIMKVREVYLSRKSTYIKGKTEDLQSTIGGIINPKGRIHYALCNPLNDFIETIDAKKQNNDYLAAIARQIDTQIYRNYKLWPTNYLAYDMLEGSSKYAGVYDNELKEKFEARFVRIKEVLPDGDMDELKDLFLKIYANPVYNQLSVIRK